MHTMWSTNCTQRLLNYSLATAIVLNGYTVYLHRIFLRQKDDYERDYNKIKIPLTVERMGT